MRCFDAAQIARAATVGIDLDPHFDECLACRRRLLADQATRAAVGRLPRPALAVAHRKQLAAEILAMTESPPARRSRGRFVATSAGALALAAAVSLTVWWPRSTDPGAVALVAPVALDEPALSSRTGVPIDPTPVLLSPQITASGGAKLAHRVGSDRDVVTLVDGLVDIDTRSSRNVEVRIGDSVVHVADATVKIRAKNRAIVSVHVVVGSAQITGPEQRVTLQVDSIWFPGPSTKVRSLTAFRDGWIALRAGRNHEAIELFDRVTDPVAREEATYWAAIAARRSGDAALAGTRIAAFLRSFPHSQYAVEILAERP